MSAALPRPTLWDRAWAWHDRLMASDGFRRWAGRFPLTRPVARRRAAALWDVTAGFVHSQVLLACVELGLFELLARGPLPEGEIARRLSLPPDSARLLLEAAESLRLTRRRGARWGLGALGAVMPGNAPVAAMVRHHPLLYADLADPVAFLRAPRGGGSLAALWPYAGADDPRALRAEDTRDYTALMAGSQPMIAAEVLVAHDFRPHRRLLDVGGGDGAFLRAVGAAHPHLALHLFDLPGVVAQAAPRFAAAGMESRATLTGGDFHRDSLPAGADVLSLVRVLHDHDDAAALSLLRRARAALAPGGTLLVAEPMAGTPGAEPMGAAYFGFYLRAMGTGRPRPAAELAAMARAAGFGGATPVSTASPLTTGLLVCSA